MKVTPQQINSLKPNEIFVFGSNIQGNHAGGAARFAAMKFGAEMGNGDGIQGNSYAIPTLTFAALKGTSLNDLKLPLNQIGSYVDKFIDFARNHPELFFYVTPIGCGIAGFTEEEIAPLFRDCLDMDNIALPEGFIRVLGGNAGLNENRKHKKVVIKESELKEIVRNAIISEMKKYNRR